MPDYIKALENFERSVSVGGEAALTPRACRQTPLRLPTRRTPERHHPRTTRRIVSHRPRDPRKD